MYQVLLLLVFLVFYQKMIKLVALKVIQLLFYKDNSHHAGLHLLVGTLNNKGWEGGLDKYILSD